MSNKVKLRAIVCPKQKKVKIMEGGRLIKTYTFKMDIPFKKVQRAVFVHDYGERCVADRDSVHFQDDVEWDKNIIQSIADRALNHHHKLNHQ